jgi:hypothetical protein
MSIIGGIFNGAVDAVFRQKLEQNQPYQNMKAALEADAEYVGTVEKVAACVGIGGVVLTFFGIGFCAARREGTGGVLIYSAVPLTIFSYDWYQASENFRTQMQEDHLKLMVLKVNEPILVNVVALRKCLLKKTLFFEPFMGFYIRSSLRSVNPETL